MWTYNLQSSHGPGHQRTTASTHQALTDQNIREYPGQQGQGYILWSWSKISLCIAGGLCLWCVSSDRSLATGQRVVSGWTCYQPVVHLPVRISSCWAHTTPAYVGLASQLTPTQKHTAQHGTLDKQAVLIMENFILHIEYRSLGQCTYVHIGKFETSYQNWGDFGESKNPKFEAHSRKK